MAHLKDKVTIAQEETIPNKWNGTMFGDLDWPLNAMLDSAKLLCSEVYKMLRFYWLAVTQNVSSFWSKDMDQLKSYRCNATETLYDGDSVAASSLRKLTVSDMLLEAFQNTSKVEFSNPGLERTIYYLLVSDFPFKQQQDFSIVTS